MLRDHHDHVADDVADHARCRDWREIDRTLRTLARRRAALDAEETRWLRAAYRVQIWREVGCVSMVDYIERSLGYGVRNAQERLKVALALGSLPALEGALASGVLPFTAIRTLLRVATPANERSWLAHCANMSVHQIEEAVSGHDKGDAPTDPKQPDLELRTLCYSEVRPSTIALEREALARARVARGHDLSDDAFLAMVFGVFLEHASVDGSATTNASASATASAESDAAEPATGAGRARYQVAVTVCEVCDQGWRDSSGKRFALDASELARARCDAQHIGSLDGEQPARATQDIPPRIRRRVWRRDRGRCTLDGCRSAANLEIHHIVAREDGGTHDPSNLTLACDGCHAALHRGLITVRGRAPDALVVHRKLSPKSQPARGAHVRAPASFDRVAIDIDAKAALVTSGFSKPEAAAAVAAVRAEVSGNLALETLLREALRRCRKPG